MSNTNITRTPRVSKELDDNLNEFLSDFQYFLTKWSVPNFSNKVLGISKQATSTRIKTHRKKGGK